MAIRVGAHLTAGRAAGLPVTIEAPVLTVAQGVAWVHQRQQRFAATPGARESVQDAILRRVLYAQGPAYRGALTHALAADGRMELEMMFSEHCHNNEPESPQGPVLRVASTGQIAGLEALDLYDNTGTRFVEQPKSIAARVAPNSYRALAEGS